MLEGHDGWWATFICKWPFIQKNRNYIEDATLALARLVEPLRTRLRAANQ